MATLLLLLVALAVRCGAFGIASLPAALQRQMPLRRAATIRLSAETAVPEDGEGSCEIIGEEKQTGTQWLVCEDGSEKSIECTEEDFGVGGGPGILPQDGQVLCKADSPKDGAMPWESGFKWPWEKQ